MDPLRLTLIIAGVVVLLAIIVFGRKSNKHRDMIYPGTSAKEFSFGAPNDDMLVDEEVIVLPPRKKTASTSPTPTAVSEKKIPETPVQKKTPQSVETRPFGPSTQNEFSENVKPEPEESDNTFQTQTPDVVFSANASKHETNTYKSHKQNETVLPKQTSAIKNETVAATETKKAGIPNVKKTPKVQERFVVLHVVATDNKPFTGQAIIESTQTLGMAFGKHAVFHYPVSSAESGNSKFCLVNMTSEGNFDPAKLPTLETIGVSLIMRLPIQGSDGLTVFSNMLGVAQTLARKLGGDILDQTRVPLTADIVTSLRSDIAHFESEVNRQTAVPEL